MAPKEPTRYQLSSRLSYNQHTPSFLLKLQNRIAGHPEEDESDQEFEPDDGSGRPPVPRRPRERPPIPERPADDPGSADEDGDDEKPVVVVLKEGKHLTEREAENIRRKVKGLPPLEDHLTPETTSPSTVSSSKPEPASSKSKDKSKSLSFSSAKSGGGPTSKTPKRKAIISDSEPDVAGGSRDNPKKKKKKEKKTLLSFGDET